MKCAQPFQRSMPVRRRSISSPTSTGYTRIDDCFEGMVEEFDEDAAHFEVENNGAKFPADLIFPRLQHQIAGTAVNQIVDEVPAFPTCDSAGC